jgi:hypothetical protein
MTDKISEAAKRKACKLANAERPPNLLCKSVPEDIDLDYHLTALARVLQEHSDVAKGVLYRDSTGYLSVKPNAGLTLRSLILPDDPDPVDALADELFDGFAIGAGHHKRRLIAALAKHGLNIIKQD